MKVTVFFLIFIITSFTARAVLELPVIFADNMILQRGMPLQVWGKSLSGKKVSINFNHQIKTVITDKNGNWKIVLAPIQAGGPYVLQVSNEDDTIILKNILIGDVWICAGQSNMNFILAAEKNGSAALKNLPTTTSGNAVVQCQLG